MGGVSLTQAVIIAFSDCTKILPEQTSCHISGTVVLSLDSMHMIVVRDKPVFTVAT